MAVPHTNHHINGKHDTDAKHTVNTIPRHVAFVCDGNSRWAQARRLPASFGHAAGADRLVDCLKALQRAGVPCCTMYGFSTENWRRSPNEIKDILAVMEQTARRFYDTAMAEQVRVCILGDLDDERLPASLCDILRKLEHDTTIETGISKKNSLKEEGKEAQNGEKARLTVCIAVNYGGRKDIVNASLRLAERISAGDVKAEDVTEEEFASLLCTSDVPDPDLIIRTGGERRLSNFLLWNAAYSEIYFTDTLWPDFDETSLEEALAWFSGRSRRFGGRESAAERTAF